MLKWKVSSINCHTLRPLSMWNLSSSTKKGKERKKNKAVGLDSLDVGATFYGPAITLASAAVSLNAVHFYSTATPYISYRLYNTMMCIFLYRKRGDGCTQVSPTCGLCFVIFILNNLFFIIRRRLAFRGRPRYYMTNLLYKNSFWLSWALLLLKRAIEYTLDR
jgi:hypothetical protein